MIRTPIFWQKKGIISLLLLPVSWLYYLGTRLHQARAKPIIAAIPVIAIGNIVAGGAGKTPTTALVANLLQATGLTPHILSRGYGAIIHSVTQVDIAKHQARDVGDEPLLLARTAPCWVHPIRAESVQAAAEHGANIAIMDDGLQHYSLAPTIRLMVVDGAYGFGNGRLLPAGPLRTPLSKAFRDIDAVILIGHDHARIRTQVPGHIPIFSANIEAHIPANLQAGAPVVAFSGIAHPQKFFNTLAQAGGNIVARHSFADHHFFTEKELQKLLRDAQTRHAQLITTEKDWVRLPKPMQQHCLNLPINLSLADETGFQQWLSNKIAPHTTST